MRYFHINKLLERIYLFKQLDNNNNNENYIIIYLFDAYLQLINDTYRCFDLFIIYVKKKITLLIFQHINRL